MAQRYKVVGDGISVMRLLLDEPEVRKCSKCSVRSARQAHQVAGEDDVNRRSGIYDTLAFSFYRAS